METLPQQPNRIRKVAVLSTVLGASVLAHESGIDSKVYDFLDEAAQATEPSQRKDLAVGQSGINRNQRNTTEPVELDMAEFSIKWMPESVTRWNNEIFTSAEKHGVNPQLIQIMMKMESGGDPTAESGAGAIGLMQIMDTEDVPTGRELAEKLGYETYDLWDPATNIEFSAKYIRDTIDRFEEQYGSIYDEDSNYSDLGLQYILIAYNAGPGVADQWYTLGIRIPNETKKYVADGQHMMDNRDA